jgi:hypothetical protein
MKTLNLSHREPKEKGNNVYVRFNSGSQGSVHN